MSEGLLKFLARKWLSCILHFAGDLFSNS